MEIFLRTHNQMVERNYFRYQFYDETVFRDTNLKVRYREVLCNLIVSVSAKFEAYISTLFLKVTMLPIFALVILATIIFHTKFEV